MGETAAGDLLEINERAELHSIGRNRWNGSISTAATGTAPPPVDPRWLADILSALAEAHHVPGAQLAVHRSGVTVAVEFGELGHGSGIPVAGYTAFPVASVCKVATATLAMILVGDGDLGLDNPLAEYLPELDDLGWRLTLSQLLSHTSGFASSPDIVERPGVSLGRYVQRHCRWQDLIVPPGTTFTYSNRNYVLVGHLIETVTGMSWSEAVESILLRPLGIEATLVGIPGRAPRGRPIATGHSVNMAVGRTRPVEQPETQAEAPGVGLGMSALDLVALGLMHVGPGFPELLPATQAEQMRQPIPGVEPFGLADGWGAGLAVYRGETTTWVGHDGNGNGTSCYLRIDPGNGSVVALTTNANTGSSLWAELRDPLDLPTLQARHRRDGLVRAALADTAEFVGSYANGPTEFLITAGDGGDLLLDIGGEPVARLAFTDDLEFRIQDPASRRGLHSGRFLRDPITRRVEFVQIGGRLAPRVGLDVPETRSPSVSVSRVSA